MVEYSDMSCDYVIFQFLVVHNFCVPNMRIRPNFNLSPSKSELMDFCLDSIWTSQSLHSLCGVHTDLWGSVNYC
jgi:hypothetical protein